MTKPMHTDRPVIIAGIPAQNLGFYRRIRFLVGDPAALILLPSGDDHTAHLIIRDIEIERAKAHARADHIHAPADFTPYDGLSGDRETATAQAAAEFLRRHDASDVWTDRALPMIFAHFIRKAGIHVHCDPDMGVLERRAKDEQEINWLRKAQRTTEQAVEMACRLIARASADPRGTLIHNGAPLTSERVREEIDVFLLRKGYINQSAIVIGGPAGADCHDRGSGELRTGQPIIIDVFPRDRDTLYNGDCTRTVVHGAIPDEVAAMHAAVLDAKRAAIAATRPGATGEDVHRAATDIITSRGYLLGLPTSSDPPTRCAMVHGTGHGVGLEVHEPPLLDLGGPPLIAGDCLTIEPGLYCPAIGGLRVEDMVIVTPSGRDNLNTIPEGLDWT